MNLRDYFASRSPITLNDAIIICGWENEGVSALCQDDQRKIAFAVLALMNYEYADAMLEQAKEGLNNEIDDSRAALIEKLIF